MTAQSYIIAEAGVNHNGSITVAMELCNAAKKTGADSIKFQTYITEKLASIETPKVEYQKKFDKHSSHFEMLKSLELSFEDQARIKEYCDFLDIEFFSTPYGQEEAEFLNSLGVKTFKVASADIVDIPLHEKIASFGKKTIISTGMSTKEEIDAVVQIYIDVNCPFALLHTTSQYPTPPSDANLSRLLVLKNIFNCEIGFSDHTDGASAALLAYGLGSRIFEKHFTIDTHLDGPDHKTSADPVFFAKYVEEIRNAGLMFGSSEFLRTFEEEGMATTSRKSLHLVSNLPKGHTVTLEDLRLVRPGTGLYWRDRNKIVGKRLLRDMEASAILNITDVEGNK